MWLQMWLQISFNTGVHVKNENMLQDTADEKCKLNYHWSINEQELHTHKIYLGEEYKLN